jgi:hypothetical protein
MHPIDVSRAAAIRSKDDPLAVRGELGVVIEGGIWQQRVLGAFECAGLFENRLVIEYELPHSTRRIDVLVCSITD